MDQAAARAAMVDGQLRARGIRDARVLAALAAVPRERFVPPALAAAAYADQPLPVGCGQTISQPYIVALMAELLQVPPGARVLEVGLGSGYAAAVLTAMGCRVYAVEILPALARQAVPVLRALGYGVRVQVADGWHGWERAAPFAGILVSAAPRVVPPPLLAQLADGGRLVIPVGDEVQELQVYTRRGDTFRATAVGGVRFVPLTGKGACHEQRFYRSDD